MFKCGFVAAAYFDESVFEIESCAATAMLCEYSSCVAIAIHTIIAQTTNTCSISVITTCAITKTEYAIPVGADT